MFRTGKKIIINGLDFGVVVRIYRRRGKRSLPKIGTFRWTILCSYYTRTFTIKTRVEAKHVFGDTFEHDFGFLTWNFWALLF